MTSFDPVTLNFYATEAPDYHANSAAGINGDLPAFLDRLAPGALILELGCGGGRDAADMVNQGFAIDPTDGVPAMAAIAEQRLGMAIRVMRFDELNAVAQYDAVYASYSLLHVPRAGLANVLRRIWTALKPGGWHMATYKSGGTEGRDNLDRYFNYLSHDQAEAFYREAGEWDCLELTHGEGPGYQGRRSPWVNVIARKPAYIRPAKGLEGSAYLRVAIRPER
ncbi:MAG: class I SAM-dependent methyltransferase [Novosphingobium sp.]